MRKNGTFTGNVSAEGGVYVRCDDVRLVEFPTGSPEEQAPESAPADPATADLAPRRGGLMLLAGIATGAVMTAVATRRDTGRRSTHER